MEYRKNDLLTLEIVDCGTDGEGIGKADGFTVFVKDAVIGDIVSAKIMKAKKNYGYARLMEVIKPSPFRVKPVCPSARQCGGCQLQALSYEQQLVFKEKKIRGNLERIGGFTEIPMEPVIGMEDPWHYRNKAQFPVGRNKEGKLVTGFYAGRTHVIIENRDCALGVPQNKEVLDRVLRHMERYQIEPYDEKTGKGLVRHIFIRYGFYSGEVMVCLILNGTAVPHQRELIASLREIPGMTSISLNVNRKKTNVILGDQMKVLWGQGYITDRIGDISYQISPLSFFQVNPRQTVKLYSKAMEYADLHGEETVWDLYCGIGTISLFLAQKAKFVRGVEIVPQAVEDARKNAELNGIRNAEFYTGKAEEVLPEYYEKYEREHGEKARADVIVVDPPRKGCDETLLDTIVKMQPNRVVYVSCDSATLARDLRYLCDRGYRLEKICGTDMFPQSVHVETIVSLTRAKSVKSYVYVDVSTDELEIQNTRKKATYKQIQAYVEEKHGLKVSPLYIAEIKDEYGLEKQYSYKEMGMDAAKRPKCPKEKHDAIVEALVHFGMLDKNKI